MRWLMGVLVIAASAPLFAAETAVAPPVLVPVSRVEHSAIGTDGSDVLVVWSEIRQRIRYGIARAGAPADAPAKLLALRDEPGEWSDDFAPAAAFAGGRWMIVWDDDPRTAGAVLDRDGNVLRRMTLSEHGSAPVIAATNGRFLVAWSRGAGGGGAVLSADGDVLATLAFPFGVNAVCESAGVFAIAGISIEPAGCDGNCQVRMNVMRLDTEGRVLAQTSFETGYVSYPPQVSIASGSDGGLLVAWQAWPSRAPGVLLDFELRRVADFDFGETRYGGPTVFWDQSHYVAITNPVGTPRFTRVGIDKTPKSFGIIEASGVLRTRAGYWILGDGGASLRFDLADSANEQRWRFLVVEDQTEPSIATDGHSVLVSWYAPGIGLRNALIANGSARALQDDRTQPVAFDGTEFVSFGDRFAQFARFTSVDGSRREDVHFDDPLFQVGSFTFLWNGSIFFSFCEDFDAPLGQSLGVRRIRRSGKVIDRKPFFVDSPCDYVGPTATNGRDAFFIVSCFGLNELGRVTPEGMVTIARCLPLFSPKIAVGDDVVFVAGTPYRSDAIFIAAFTPSLRLRWPDAISLADGGGDTIDLAADGREAVAVWREPGRIAGARVTSEGNVTRFVVREGSDPVARPRVAAANGAVAFAYERLIPEEPYFGARRVFVQLVPAPPRRRAAGR